MEIIFFCRAIRMDDTLPLGPLLSVFLFLSSGILHSNSVLLSLRVLVVQRFFLLFPHVCSPDVMQTINNGKMKAAKDVDVGVELCSEHLDQEGHVAHYQTPVC